MIEKTLFRLRIHELAHMLNRHGLVPDGYLGYLCERYDEWLGVFDD